MPRLSRLVVPDYPHHITRRDVRSMEIFVGDRLETIALCCGSKF